MYLDFVADMHWFTLNIAEFPEMYIKHKFYLLKLNFQASMNMMMLLKFFICSKTSGPSADEGQVLEGCSADICDILTQVL